MRIALTAALALGLIAASQWYYQPSIPTSIVGAIVMALLLVVVSWSATRFGASLKGALKTLVVGLVSGLMFSQAMDITYVPIRGGFTSPHRCNLVQCLGVDPGGSAADSASAVPSPCA